jgi:hypothetical protein
MKACVNARANLALTLTTCAFKQTGKYNVHIQGSNARPIANQTCANISLFITYNFAKYIKQGNQQLNHVALALLMPPLPQAKKLTKEASKVAWDILKLQMLFCKTNRNKLPKY